MERVQNLHVQLSDLHNYHGYVVVGKMDFRSNCVSLVLFLTSLCLQVFIVMNLYRKEIGLN